ncbi:STAS domain-containing protein [Actinomadura sp. 21ATH]|uniref:STAS domain-containing protein n=1 Tax=Actinomadura sp. 21ATH TaxID=1735444 RepID=UPI0035C01344
MGILAGHLLVWAKGTWVSTALDDPDDGLKLRMRIASSRTWVVVQMDGELDLATAAAFADRVGELISVGRAPRIALEVSRLRFCDSSGINALIRLWKRAAAAGGQVVLVRPPQTLVTVLATTGLDRFLRIRDVLPGSCEAPMAAEPA